MSPKLSILIPGRFQAYHFYQHATRNNALLELKSSGILILKQIYILQIIENNYISLIPDIFSFLILDRK